MRVIVKVALSIAAPETTNRRAKVAAPMMTENQKRMKARADPTSVRTTKVAKPIKIVSGKMEKRNRRVLKVVAMGKLPTYI